MKAKAVFRTLLGLLAVALAACGGGGQPPTSVRVTMDWVPLIRASGLDGQDGPITLTGTLEGTPTAPLKLQLSYRPKDGNWGPWQDMAELQVQGSQVTATIPAPGLDLPVGLDELGKEVRARVVMGDQVLQSLAGREIHRFHPVWATQWSYRGREYYASQAALCGYAHTDWQGYRSRVVCWNPENGEPLVQADLTGFRIFDVFVSPEGKVYLAGEVSTNREPAVRVYASPQALETADFAEFRLTGTFDHVTAVAAEGDHLYVGGNRRIAVDQCYGGSFLRVRLAKYALSGSGAALVALHDPTPEDLQEIDLPRYTSFCEEESAFNSTSVPLMRLDGGKLYAAFVHTRTVYFDDTVRYAVANTGCLGLMRLDTTTFQREWLNRPLRSGANGEERWSGTCDRDGRDRSLWMGYSFFYYNSENPPCRFYGCHTVVFSYQEFDIGDAYLYASSLYEPGTFKAKLIRKDDGQEEVTETRLEKFVFTGNSGQFVGQGAILIDRDGSAHLTVTFGTFGGRRREYKVEGIRPPLGSFTYSSHLFFREGGKVYLFAPAENGSWVVRIR
ncbi:hypothetical protein [Fervidobacterium sp.]